MTQTHDHWELLRAYVDTGDEQAFSRLVNEYVNLVYSAALRQVHGNKHLAEEVTQVVFIILARKADSIRWDTVLSAWLYKTTRYTAMNLLRAEARRQAHERKAAEMVAETMRVDSSWTRMSPLLDQGIARLREKDRAAIVLRFFEQRSIAETAQAMGVTEQAAAMRVHRAVDKLRAWFRERRVDLPTAALGGIIWANSVHSAPHGFGGAVAANALHAVTGAWTASSALAAAASKSLSTADSVIHTMAVAKAKVTACMLGSAMAASLALGLVMNHYLGDAVHRMLTPPQQTDERQAWNLQGLKDSRIAAINNAIAGYVKPASRTSRSS
jgi:RNA polymerase sigma factor (sigma-70 family)